MYIEDISVRSTTQPLKTVFVQLSIAVFFRRLTSLEHPLLLSLTSEQRRNLAYFLVFLTPAMWSANYIVARAAPGSIGPHLLAFSRWFLALCLMLPFAVPELIQKWPQYRSEWRRLLFLGALGMWICGAFVYIGGETTEALNIGLLYAIAPVLIAVASALMFDDRLRGLQMLGLCMSLLGMLIIVLKGHWGNLFEVNFTRGDLWILTAVISWTLYSILLRKWQSALSTFTRLAAITAGGLLVLLPFTIAEISTTGPPAELNKALILVVVAAVLPGFGAYQAYSFLQQELGAARAGLVLYVSPVYTALIAWWLLSEPPQSYHAVGAALILPGMYLAIKRQ